MSKTKGKEYGIRKECESPHAALYILQTKGIGDPNVCAGNWRPL